MLQCLQLSLATHHPCKLRLFQCLSRNIASFTASETFPIAPGGLLHICCTQPGTAVELTNGAEDAVTLQVQQQKAAGTPPEESSSSSSSSQFDMQMMPGGRIIDVVELTKQDASGSSGSSSSQAAERSSALLAAAIPSRFCGVHVSTVGGGVSVGKIQEAELQLVTRGGSVAVKSCKASNAAINTARDPQLDGGGSSSKGGDMQVGELSASQLRLSSGGGSITLQRMFGLDAEVLTSGGQLNIGALYGAKAVLGTLGGSLSLGHMACSGLAQLESGGGSLAVDGLEGNASLISSGGDVKVHLHEQFGHVFCDSGGGNVEAWISPAAAVTLQVAAGAGVELDPALKVTGELGPISLKGVTAGSSSSGASSSSSPPMQVLVQQMANSAAVTAGALPQATGSSFNASRLHRASSEVTHLAAADVSSSSTPAAGTAANTASSSGCCKHTTGQGAGDSNSNSNSCRGTGCSTSPVQQLTINAGGGRVTLRAMGWMDGVKAKLAQRKK